MPLMVRLVISHSGSNNGQFLQSTGTMLVQFHFTVGETEHRLEPRAPSLCTAAQAYFRFAEMGKTKQRFSF